MLIDKIGLVVTEVLETKNEGLRSCNCLHNWEYRKHDADIYIIQDTAAGTVPPF